MTVNAAALSRAHDGRNNAVVDLRSNAAASKPSFFARQLALSAGGGVSHVVSRNALERLHRA